MPANCPSCGHLSDTPKGKKTFTSKDSVIDVFRWKCLTKECRAIFYKDSYYQIATLSNDMWIQADQARVTPYSDDMIEGVQNTAEVYEQVITRNKRLSTIYSDPAGGSRTWSGMAKSNRERLERGRRSMVRRDCAY